MNECLWKGHFGTLSRGANRWYFVVNNLSIIKRKMIFNGILACLFTIFMVSLESVKLKLPWWGRGKWKRTNNDLLLLSCFVLLRDALQSAGKSCLETRVININDYCLKNRRYGLKKCFNKFSCRLEKFFTHSWRLLHTASDKNLRKNFLFLFCSVVLMFILHMPLKLCKSQFDSFLPNFSPRTSLHDSSLWSTIWESKKIVLKPNGNLTLYQRININSVD